MSLFADGLGLSPFVLDGIEVGGIRRKIFQSVARLAEGVLDVRAFVEGGVVQDDHGGSGELRQEDVANPGELSTGQNFQRPQEIVELLGEVEGDVAQEVEAVAEERLERSAKCFFKGIGRSWSWSCSPVRWVQAKASASRPIILDRRAASLRWVSSKLKPRVLRQPNRVSTCQRSA